MPAHPFDRVVLTCSGLWSTEVFLPLVHATVRFHIRAYGPGPALWQRAVFDDFMAGQDLLQPRLQEALLSYYLSIADEYREMLGPDGLTLAPELSTYSALHLLLEPQSLVIPSEVRPRGEVGVLYNCSWDPGHGVGVRVCDHAVVEVGPQDICL